MAFNASNYVKDSSKPFSNRLTDTIVNTATYGMPTSTNGIARATAIAMVNAGSTYNLAADIAAGRTFSAGDSNGDQYYLAAGKDPTRTARVSAQNFRRQNLSTDDYTTHVLPLTKIGKYRQDNTVEIIAVI